jgi:FG-GAP-like repeat
MRTPIARTVLGFLVALIGCVCAGCGGGGGGAGGGNSCGYLACDLRFGIAAADFNGDGLVDLAIPIVQIAHTDEHSMYVFLQQPLPGNPLAAPMGFSIGDDTSTTIAADIDGDGLRDIVAISSKSNALWLLLNQRDQPGTFVLAPRIVSGGNAQSVVAADLDGDGRADLIEADAGGISIHLQLAQSPGEFAPATFIAVNGCCDSIAVGDVNGDGLPDLIAVGDGGLVILLQIAGQPGAFESPAHPFAEPASRCVEAADLNGDGLLDLVYGGPANASGGVSSMRVALQDAGNPGHFIAPASYGVVALTAAATTCLVHDLTGNNRPDIIVGSENGLSVLLQDPAHPGTFSSANYALGYEMFVAVADMNGDGLPDIVAAQGPHGAAPGVLYQDATHPGTFGDFQDLP